MNDQPPFRLTPSAARDLYAILNYVGQDSVNAARSLSLEFLNRFRVLSYSPAMGLLRSDLTDQPVRSAMLGSYLIVYQSEPKPLSVLRVLSANPNILQVHRLQDQLSDD